MGRDKARGELELTLAPPFKRVRGAGALPEDHLVASLFQEKAPQIQVVQHRTIHLRLCHFLSQLGAGEG